MVRGGIVGVHCIGPAGKVHGKVHAATNILLVVFHPHHDTATTTPTPVVFLPHDVATATTPTPIISVVFLPHDGDDEGRPSGEGMRAFAVARDVVVVLPDVAGAPILGDDVVDHVRPQLRVDLAS